MYDALQLTLIQIDTIQNSRKKLVAKITKKKPRNQLELLGISTKQNRKPKNQHLGLFGVSNSQLEKFQLKLYSSSKTVSIGLR